MFRPTNPDPLIEIDPDTVSVDGGPRTSNFYWGVLSPGGNFVEIDIALDLMSKFDSSGFVRSFTAVYSSSNVTLPIGVHGIVKICLVDLILPVITIKKYYYSYHGFIRKLGQSKYHAVYVCQRYSISNGKRRYTLLQQSQKHV